MSETKRRSLKTVLCLTGIAAVLAFAVAGPASAQECVVQPGGYWPLDAEAPPYPDLAGDPGTPGVCIGPAACPAPITDPAVALVGNSQQFAGAQGINIPDTEPTPEAPEAQAVFDWAGTESFSISVWVRTDVVGDTEVLVGRQDLGATDLQWWIGLLADPGAPGAYPAFRLWDGAGVVGDLNTRLTAAANIADDAWHHIVVVRDEATNQNILYVDGVQQDAGTYDYAGDFIAVNTPINIGHMNSDFSYTGLLDEVALFDAALTADQVGLIYTAGQAGAGLCTHTNQSPVIDEIGEQAADVNVPFSVTVTATDPEGDLPLAWEIVAGPDGASITPNEDGTNAEISWTPPSDQDQVMTVRATDALGNFSEASFTVIVGDRDNQPPLIDPIMDQTTTAGTPVTVTVTASDPEGDIPLTFTAIGPEGVTATPIDDTSAEITWTPPDDQDELITVQAADALGNVGEASFTVIVGDPDTTDPATDPVLGGGGSDSGCFIDALF